MESYLNPPCGIGCSFWKVYSIVIASKIVFCLETASHSSGCSQKHSVTKGDLELLILLPSPLKVMVMDLLTVAATPCSLPRKLMVYEISIPFILSPQQLQQGELGSLLRILRTLILIDKSI